MLGKRCMSLVWGGGWGRIRRTFEYCYFFRLKFTCMSEKQQHFKLSKKKKERKEKRMYIY